MMKNFSLMLLLGVLALITFSCKKIEHRIDDDRPFVENQNGGADTTLVPITMTFPEARFTQKDFFGAYLESNSITSRIISLIDAAGKGSTIHMSIYQLNQDEILNAFERADKRGVNLRLLVDMSRVDSQRINPKAFNFLRNSKLKNTQVWDTNNDITESALNENKFVLFSEIETTSGIQEKVVFQSSQNFTDADSRYGQDALTLADENIYDAYLAYWNELKTKAVSGMTAFNYSKYSSAATNTEVHFLPYRNNGVAINGDLSVDLLNKITNPATAEIRVAMAYWDNTRLDILNKLVQLREQGAKIELVLKSNLSAPLSQFEVLESKGAFLRIINVNDNTKPLTNMESRFTTIKGTFDGVDNAKVVITGGLSYTGNSLKNSNSILLVLKNDALYDQYESYFNELKSLPEARSGGPLYPSFPESFEPVNDANSNVFYTPETTVALKTGDWKIIQGGLRNEITDKIVSGTHAWRSNFNIASSIYLSMNFDLPNGASKVSFYYGTWGTTSTGNTSKFVLEYSTNQGTTWTAIGNDVTAAAWTPIKLTYDVDIAGLVRFRIHRKGQAASGAGNGRLNIDDFSVYSKP